MPPMPCYQGPACAGSAYGGALAFQELRAVLAFELHALGAIVEPLSALQPVRLGRNACRQGHAQWADHRRGCLPSSSVDACLGAPPRLAVLSVQGAMAAAQQGSWLGPDLGFWLTVCAGAMAAAQQ